VGPPARPPLSAARRAGEAVVVVVVALALAGGLVLLGDPDLRGDQNAYNLLVAKKVTYTYRQGDETVTIVFFNDQVSSKESNLHD